jgi:hypothetical protein
MFKGFSGQAQYSDLRTTVSRMVHVRGFGNEEANATK